MKTNLFLIFLLLTTINSMYDLFPQVPKEYTIAPWHNFKSGVITYSFDDGSPNQLKVGVPLMDKYDLKASFNLIINGWDPDWEGYKKAAENGHEIASHTYTHNNLVGLSKEQELKEIKDSKEFIENKIGQECITFVYPYCVAGNYSIMSQYYISGRTCDGKYISSNPDDMFYLSSFAIGSAYSITTADKLNEMVNKALELEEWIVFLIHGIDNDGGFSPIESNELDAHLSYVKSNDEFWVATFKDVSKYVLEANSLIIEESKNGKNVNLVVKCSYETNITKMDFPVTVARSLEGLCEMPKIVGGDNESVESRVENDKVIFDVIPGKNYVIKCD